MTEVRMRHLAARAVAGNATDSADLADLLAMLGLTANEGLVAADSRVEDRVRAASRCATDRPLTADSTEPRDDGGPETRTGQQSRRCVLSGDLGFLCGRVVSGLAGLNG